MDVVLHCFAWIALAEMGDKTQLLSIMLAARYRTFWPILIGVLIATLVNHGVTSWLGIWLSELVAGGWLGLITGVLFIAVGLWTLLPDDAPDESKHHTSYGAFFASLVAFFFAEIGDKTQLATLTLAADYQNIWLVTVGTTLGMLAANIPAILLGDTLLAKLPLKALRYATCALFAATGLWQIYSWVVAVQ
ncbi:UPF0016 domain-containing protein [bacterium]|nr:UPF0016 domain-containing protein [bacterium]